MVWVVRADASGGDIFETEKQCGLLTAAGMRAAMGVNRLNKALF
jgi:hypothetical protein